MRTGEDAKELFDGCVKLTDRLIALDDGVGSMSLNAMFFLPQSTRTDASFFEVR